MLTWRIDTGVWMANSPHDHTTIYEITKWLTGFRLSTSDLVDRAAPLTGVWPDWPAKVRTLTDEGTFSTLAEAKAQAEKLAARAVEEDRRKCDVCPLLHDPEFRVQGGKIDIVERCGASGYPIGCVSADYYCKIEEMKRRREE